MAEEMLLKTILKIVLVSVIKLNWHVVMNVNNMNMQTQTSKCMAKSFQTLKLFFFWKISIFQLQTYKKYI